MDRGVWQTTVHGVAKELDRAYQLKQCSLYLENSKFSRIHRDPGLQKVVTPSFPLFATEKEEMLEIKIVKK